MIDTLKKLHFHVTAQALLFLILGLVMVFSPDSVTAFLVRLVAVVILLMGAFVLLGGLTTGSAFSSLSGGILTMIGLWAFSRPNTVAAFLPAIFGVVMLYHGVQDIGLALESKGYRASSWGGMIVIGIISVILGLVCIFGAFGVLKLVTRVIGIMIIADAIGDMILVRRTNQASKDIVDGEVVSEEDIGE